MFGREGWWISDKREGEGEGEGEGRKEVEGSTSSAGCHLPSGIVGSCILLNICVLHFNSGDRLCINCNPFSASEENKRVPFHSPSSINYTSTSPLNIRERHNAGKRERTFGSAPMKTGEIIISSPKMKILTHR